MSDDFFTKKNCDRCGGSLADGRTMSRFDTACLCMRCEAAEQRSCDYQRAVEAEQAEIRKGNYNYRGIGLPVNLRRGR